MNGKTTIPEKSWQAEQKKLIEYRFLLHEKFYWLKDEMRNRTFTERRGKYYERGQAIRAKDTGAGGGFVIFIFFCV